MAYLLEYQWIQKRLAEEAELGHSGAVKLNQLLQISWENPDWSCWDIAKVIFK